MCAWQHALHVCRSARKSVSKVSISSKEMQWWGCCNILFICSIYHFCTVYIYIYVCDVYSIRLLNCQHMIPSKICVCIRIYIYITHTFMCTCNYIHRLLKCQTWYFDRIFFLGLSGQARAYWAGEGDAPPSAQGLVRQASSWESVFSAACCCISLDRVGYYCWV